MLPHNFCVCIDIYRGQSEKKNPEGLIFNGTFYFQVLQLYVFMNESLQKASKNTKNISFK